MVTNIGSEDELGDGPYFALILSFELASTPHIYGTPTILKNEGIKGTFVSSVDIFVSYSIVCI